MVDQHSLDELALLGEDLESDRAYIGDINEDELLGLNEPPVCLLLKQCCYILHIESRDGAQSNNKSADTIECHR